MAVLSDSDRAALHAQWMREPGNQVDGCVKADLRAAINAIDDWVNSNAAAFNTAIPQPARAALTARQKAWLLTYVVKRRFEVS